MTTRPLRIVFAGTPDFSVAALDALHAAGHSLVAVYTQPDRPAGRGRALTASPVKQRALALGLPVEQPATLRDPQAAAHLAGFEPDLMVVVAYGLILPQPILDVPRLGCLNIHASLLPRWRGAAPIQRAILAGDRRTGITIMKMDAGLDTGPALLERAVEIGRGETGGQLHDRLASLGAEAVVTAIDEWMGGSLAPQPQPAEGVTYAAKLRKDEAVIDWNRPAAELERLVLAFNPWPVAETAWRGQQLRIWRAVAVDDEPPAGAQQGEVVSAADGRILVATGHGVLQVDTLQLPGRKPTAAADFLKANALAGCRLGRTHG